TPTKGAFLGKKVGATKSTISGGIPYTLDSEIKSQRMLGAFDTEAAAIAVVKANGKAGAVTVESGKFVAYETDIGFGYRDRYSAAFLAMSGGGSSSHAPELAPGVIALISNEKVTVRAGEFDPGAKRDAPGSADAQLASTDDP